MKTTLSLGTAVLSGGALGFAWGFHSGVGTGAEAMGHMAAHNRVSVDLGRIDSSVKSLNKNDLAYSIGQHQRDLKSALLDLGAYAPEVTQYWQCKDMDRAIIGNANDYLKAHPEIKEKGFQSDQTFEQMLSQALKFCQQ